MISSVVSGASDLVLELIFSIGRSFDIIVRFFVIWPYYPLAIRLVILSSANENFFCCGDNFMGC